MNTTADSTEGAVFDNLRGVRDALSVRRVFGDPFVVDGVTIVPVARVSGGAGGGGGEGTGPDESGGRGFGTGFGLTARPVGVYRIENGDVTWKPTIDADRLAHGGQVLAGIVTVCTALVLLRWRRAAG